MALGLWGGGWDGLGGWGMWGQPGLGRVMLLSHPIGPLRMQSRSPQAMCIVRGYPGVLTMNQPVITSKIADLKVGLLRNVGGGLGLGGWGWGCEAR